ncbi:MAG TPA: DUF5665 domain-containing protein [Bacillota bacterium]|nr:DUF5665 domain-containing protein [Bacillota bacterium]
MLLRQLATFNHLMQRNQIAAIAELVQRPLRILFLNFLAGLARGFGIAIGLTLIAGAFLVLLTRLASLNLPLIGKYIAEIVRIVNSQLQTIPH